MRNGTLGSSNKILCYGYTTKTNSVSSKNSAASSCTMRKMSNYSTVATYSMNLWTRKWTNGT